jgi:hypothetical protein
MNDLRSIGTGGLAAGLLLLLFACSGQNDRQDQAFAEQKEEGHYAQGEPVMRFDTLVHDFGTIIEGEKVVCYFDYANDGAGDLVITGVETTCGCTIPQWSMEPLKPGTRETLELIFDATGRSGEQRKTITVKSNAKNQMVRLTIRANVIKRIS